MFFSFFLILCKTNNIKFQNKIYNITRYMVSNWNKRGRPLMLTHLLAFTNKLDYSLSLH